MRFALAAAGGILLVGFGFELGVNSEGIRHSMADIAPLGFTGTVKPAEAAYAAYEKGDHVTALRRLRPIAQQGDARAQFLLGSIYYTAPGNLRDDAEAAKWFDLAAHQGDAAAEFRLGLMYSEGQGVPQDHAEAARWYRRAADKGYAPAQHNLGLAYAAGEGVAQDRLTAHMWLNLAVAQFPASDARNRNMAIRSRDVVASKLTREQIAEAQKLASAWRAIRVHEEQEHLVTLRSAGAG
jgi:TPR repeat protein